MVAVVMLEVDPSDCSNCPRPQLLEHLDPSPNDDIHFGRRSCSRRSVKVGGRLTGELRGQRS
jgi:hypothetical protein